MNLLTVRLPQALYDDPALAGAQCRALADLITERANDFDSERFDVIVVLGTFGWHAAELERLDDLFNEFHIEGADNSHRFAAITMVRGELTLCRQPVAVRDSLAREGYWLDVAQGNASFRLMVLETGFCAFGLRPGQFNPDWSLDTTAVSRLVLCGHRLQGEPQLLPVANRMMSQLTANPTSALSGATITRTHFL